VVEFPLSDVFQNAFTKGAAVTIASGQENAAVVAGEDFRSLT
jgi:hypothetical protein